MVKYKEQEISLKEHIHIVNKNIVQEIMEKINMLNSTIYELKDNMEAMSDIPSKLSELQNDTNFVSEQTLINAINTRGLINEEQLNKNSKNT